MNIENLPEAPLRILVVDDNPADVRIVRMALQEARGPRIEIAVAEDGEQAIGYLRRQGPYAQSFRPDLVILDLNIPRYSGSEVLHAIRADAGLTHLPVVVLSSSPAHIIHEKVRAADVEADGYFAKPMHLDEFIALGKQIISFYRHAREAEMREIRG